MGYWHSRRFELFPRQLQRIKKWKAASTNGDNDVNISNYKYLEKDLKEIGFKSFEHVIEKTGPGDGHGNWIWVQSRK